MKYYSPHFLLYTRLFLGPVLLLSAAYDMSGAILFWIFLFAVLTDVFDGIVARRLGVATEWLRRADSAVDTVFFIFVLIVLYKYFSDTWDSFKFGIFLVVSLEVIRIVYDQMKFGRQSAYHMYSAKLWGLTLLMAFSEVFLTGNGGPLFLIGVVVGVIANLEALAASVILKNWRHDVPSLYHIVSKKHNNQT